MTNKFQNTVIVQPQRGSWHRCGNPCDCALCGHGDTREFTPAVILEKPGKQFAWLVYTRLILT